MGILHPSADEMKSSTVRGCVIERDRAAFKLVYQRHQGFDMSAIWGLDMSAQSLSAQGPCWSRFFDLFMQKVRCTQWMLHARKGPQSYLWETFVEVGCVQDMGFWTLKGFISGLLGSMSCRPSQSSHVFKCVDWSDQHANFYQHDVRRCREGWG